MKEYNSKISRGVNVVIAAFVTSYARVHLYSILSKLNHLNLYSDTDSTWVLCKRESYVPPQNFQWPENLKDFVEPEAGMYLGDLTNEILEKYGPDWIGTGFVSPCSKTYCVELTNIKNPDGEKKYYTRCKGISLSTDTVTSVNFDAFEALVKGEKPHIDVPATNFKAGRDGGVRLLNSFKKLSMIYKKRRIVNDGTFSTLPWGYTE